MLIVVGKRGLCNRIKSLISALHRDKGCKVLWKNSKALGCAVSDLFDNDFKISSIPDGHPEKNLWGGWRLVLLDHEKPLLPPGMEHIDFAYKKIPHVIRKSVLNTIDILKIKKHILESVDSFAERFDDQTISVHVRTWNPNQGGGSAGKSRRRKFRLEKYYKILDGMPSSSNFFVSADSKHAIDMMSDRYGDRVHFKSHKLDSQKQGSINAMIDLLILSKNKLIIGSNKSTFTEMSWWFGGCLAKVILVDC